MIEVTTLVKDFKEFFTAHGLDLPNHQVNKIVKYALSDLFVLSSSKRSSQNFYSSIDVVKRAQERLENMGIHSKKVMPTPET